MYPEEQRKKTNLFGGGKGSGGSCSRGWKRGREGRAPVGGGPATYVLHV